MGLEDSRKYPNELFQAINSSSSSTPYNSRLNSGGFTCSEFPCFLQINFSKF